MQLAPKHMLYRLNRAAALLELQRYKESTDDCKSVVTIGRSWQYKRRRVTSRSGSDSLQSAVQLLCCGEESDMTSGKGASDLIAKAYARLGSGLQRQKQIAKVS